MKEVEERRVKLDTKARCRLQSGGLLLVQICGASGGGTLAEQRPLEESTQWKLSFQLCVSVAEQGETKGQRRSQSESRGKSLTRSTKHLRDARPLVCFCRSASCTHARKHTHRRTRTHATFHYAMRLDSGQRRTVEGDQCDSFSSLF